MNHGTTARRAAGRTGSSRAARLTAAGIAALALARAATSALRIVPPEVVLALLLRRPSTHGTLFAARAVPASTQPRPLPRVPRELPGRVPWYEDTWTLPQFLDRTRTNAFLVLNDGALVHEWYRAGVRPTTRHPSWSVAKSVVSLLVGQAVERGTLREDERVVDILPELANGTAFDEITVRHLLDMSSGVDVTENYNPMLPLRGTAHLLLTTDLGRFLDRHRRLTFAPGSAGEYRSIDTQLLGEVLSRREGRSLSELLGHELWGPVGAQDEARWNLDREDGREKAFCGLNATARDFAKVGQLVLEEGLAGDRRVVPAAWIARLHTPAPHPVDGWGYSAQWWHPSLDDRGDICAIGVHGQYVYVDPRSRTVAVKLSDHGTEQDELATIGVLRHLADALAVPHLQ